MAKIKHRAIENVRENLRTLLAPYGEKQRLVHASRECFGTIRGVLQGRVDPSMNLMISACYLYGLTPDQMMNGPIKLKDLKAIKNYKPVGTPTPREREIAECCYVFPQAFVSMKYGVSRQYVSYCLCKTRKFDEVENYGVH